MFNNQYKGKTVLITGHTGFKGTWLSIWLLKLGARVVGVSNEVPTKPSMFEVLDMESKIDHHFCDIRNLEALRDIVEKSKPDFLFHLAAQPIVSLSYEDPIGTLTTNVIGTANVLEVLREFARPCIAVLITSDKCYENVEWEWGYKETDHLGGRDIYSGSKGAAEVVIHAYDRSFFQDQNHPVTFATGRAGNVIGGGDWAKDRIVVDCMRTWSEKQIVEIRSPDATRPWQHVLEPLSGYLALGAKLAEDRKLQGQCFNFGPRAEQNRTVLELLNDLGQYWDFKSYDELYKVTDNIPFHEAGLLKLNCDKALFHLSWEATLEYKSCVKLVSEWYYAFYRKQVDMAALTMEQIEFYENEAFRKGVAWSLKS